MPDDVAYKGARGGDYGSPAEQREWMRKGTQQRSRDGLLRQFQKLESGNGNSEAFREGYDRIRWTEPQPWRTCLFCGMTRESVAQRPDPWAHEVAGDATPVDICDPCTKERLHDT
jgi:hypothetical protein